MITQDKWEWFGQPGHFICGRWCRFHLLTLIGDYVVSTVGEYVHPSRSQGSERIESEWLAENFPGDDIGYGRKYETMVFRLKGRCADLDCQCGGVPMIEPSELDAGCYNTAADAREGHMKLCRKWASNEHATLSPA